MKIKLRRPFQITDGARKYHIVVDGVRLGTLSSGKELEIEVPDGANSIWAEVDWCSSNKLPLSSVGNQTIFLEVRNRFGCLGMVIPFIGMYYALIRRNRYLEMRLRPTVGGPTG
jgi:hypothetical protein